MRSMILFLFVFNTVCHNIIIFSGYFISQHGHLYLEAVAIDALLL